MPAIGPVKRRDLVRLETDRLRRSWRWQWHVEPAFRFMTELESGSEPSTAS
jgi:hypothetical protein